MDTEGLAALSMRRLGSVLSVDPMAIYYHLPNKAALYDAIVEAVMAEMSVPEGGALGNSKSPGELLRQMALSYRDALLAHPNALPVVAARPVRTPASLRPIERMLDVIARQGFTPQDAMAIVDVCGHYIMGWAQTYAAHLHGAELHEHDPLRLEDLSEAEFPNLRRVLETTPLDNPFAVEFDLGIDVLMEGLLSRKR